MTRNQPPEVVIAGGGVAALEFALALRTITGDAVHLTVVAAKPDFVLRPALVAAPLGVGRYWRGPLSELAEEIGFSLVAGRVRTVDGDGRRVIVGGGDAVP